MAQYGEIRVDYITYTTGVSPNEVNVTVPVSGLVNSPSFSGDVVVSGDLTLDSNALISGDVIASGNITGGNITATGDLSVSGDIIGDNITATGDLNVSGDITGNNITATGDLNVSGDIIGDNITATGDLNVSGDITGNNITATGNLNASGDIVGGNITATGDLSVSGDIIGDNITATGDLNVSGDITGNNITATGNLNASGDIVGGNITATGNVIVSGDLTVIGDIDASGVTISGFTGLFDDGTEASPSITFAADQDTGFYRAGDNKVAISTNGVERVEIGTSEVVFNDGGEDIDFRVEGDTEANLLLVDAGNDRIQIGGPIGVGGANFGSVGQVLVSNGSSAAPSWEDVTSSAVFGWDHDNDTYGLYLPGTSIKTSDLTGTVDIDVQSRMRRCVINDSGVVQYYLDADDSDLKAGDWLRIVETEALDTAYTGTHSESTNSLLRVGVPAWSAGTFTRGQRVTNGSYLWECIAASTTATPAAGTIASDLTGTDGQVVVEVPAFSVRYVYLNGVHTREVRLGCNDSLIAQGFQPHPAFIKTDGTYKDAFYIGAYYTYDDAGTGSSVSGQTNTRSQTRAIFRSKASNRGTGWHVLSYLELAAIQTLLVCEFRDYNSQRAVGNGANAGTTYGVTTGQSDADGNHSVNSTDNASDADNYMAYRGIENLYGRAWQFVDGINVYERVVYLTNDQTAFADNTSVGYEFYAQVPSGSSSYQKELHPLPDVFLPSVVTGASDTTYLGDTFWTSTGWRVARVGGNSGYGAQAGAFCLFLIDASGFSYSSIGARLAYAAN